MNLPYFVWTEWFEVNISGISHKMCVSDNTTRAQFKVKAYNDGGDISSSGTATFSYLGQ